MKHLLTRHPSRFVIAAAVLTCVLIQAAPAHAQRELRVKTIPETPLDFVTTVTAPLTRGMAFSDPANAVVTIHHDKHTAHVSVHKLDPQGGVVAEDPATMMLPKPASLANRPTNVLGVVCHPRQPVVYVWQDVEPAEPFVPLDPSLAVEFDHLWIYSLEESPPRLLMSTCRGESFSCGSIAGGMAFDAARDRLYVPNMRQYDTLQKKAVTAIGWIFLEADGLPALVKADEPPTPVPHVSPDELAAAPLDLAAGAAARAAKMAAFEQGKASGMPLVPKRATHVSLYSFAGSPAPYNYAPLDGRTVLTTGHSGPVSWHLTDQSGHFNCFFLQPYVPYRYRVAVHPVQPALYVTTLSYDGRLVWLQHADGYITLTPRILSVDGLVTHSVPLVLATRNQLAIGAVNSICLIDLDDSGRFKTSAVKMAVNNPTVEAIAWSERLSRLYVPVEKAP
ncbi:MAG: hypothetical protein AB7O62_07865 [Pirellulales bacterium]